MSPRLTDWSLALAVGVAFGSGIISHRLACWTWMLFRTMSRPLNRRRDFVLSLCGPIILVAVVSTWVIGLTLGSSLVIKPMLGSSIRALPLRSSLLDRMEP